MKTRRERWSAGVVGGAMEALAIPALLALIAFSGGCVDEPLPTDFPNRPGGNPLVPTVALLPFPSDFYLVEDPTTVTGRRLSIPQEALPDHVPAGIFDDADGFTMTPTILAWLPGGVDLASLPDPLDPGATLEDDSPVFLVETTGWTRVPVLAEVDANTDDVALQLLLIRAHVKLEPDTGYVVILRDGLRTREGEPHVAAEAFRALRDGRATADPDVERLRPSFDLVNRAIAEGGLDPEEVVLAWAFHTRSEEQVVSTLMEMQWMTWEAPTGDWTIDATEVDGENWIADGTFEAPNFLDADGLVQLDAQGLPISQGTYDEEFRLTVPLSVTTTRPVIVYGHGFFGLHRDSSGGAVNQLCRERGYSTIATNLGFNESDGLTQLEILATRLEDFHWIVSLHWQKLVNQTALAKLVQDRLSTDLSMDRGGGPFLPLDGDAVHYSGISNGGTYGYLVASTSPAFERAVLIVGGGGLTHFLQRAVNWRDFEWFFDGWFENELEMQILLATLQIPLDPVDSINYVHRLTNDRFPGLGPMQASVHMAVNDSQVRNILTEWTCRTAGVPLITPSAKDIWGLETVTAALPEGATGVDSALHVYDEHVEPSPITNVPPLEDNGTHGTATRLPVMQEAWYQFLEHGRFVQVCDGPCDPD